MKTNHDTISAYPATAPLNVAVLQEEWQAKRLTGWEELQKNRLTPFQAAVTPYLPFGAVAGIGLVILSASWQVVLGLVIVLFAAAAISLRIYYLLWKNGNELAAETDASMLISVERWVEARYGITDLDLRKDLQKVLTMSNGDSYISHTGIHLAIPSEEYRLEFLDTRSNISSAKLIIANVHGEAPLI